MSKLAKPEITQPESKDTSSSHGDPSYLYQVFPDSGTLFEQKQEPIATIKGNCIVALDANVLLLPYQMNKVSLQEVSMVYTTIESEGRLLIPGQAAREFAVHRAAKIGDIVSHLKKEADSLKKPLSQKIGFLENEQAYNDVKEVAAKIETLQKEFRNKAAAIADGLSGEIGNDPVSLIYSQLKAAIKDLPWSSDEQKKFAEDLANRSRYKIPPGYMDGKKMDGGPGDLLIWKTILSEGKSQNKHCIFVTAEEKPDWWVRSHGAFQPRVELIEEYRNVTNGRTIHIVVLSKLLALFDVADDTVVTVRRVEQANTALAILAGSSKLDATPSHYTFRAGVSQEQANDLAILRDAVKVDIAQVDTDIEKWRAIEPSVITAAQIQQLSEEREQLRKKLEWIERQLKLTPPDEPGGSQ